MRILDLLVLSFHRDLKDKTTFKILNQSINSGTYSYDIKDNKFKKCIDKTIIEGTYLGVDAENALWEIEIIDDLID